MKTNIRVPSEAICHVCGSPMKVIHHENRAASLGFKMSEGELWTIECCGYELRIEDDSVAREVKQILEAYHASSMTQDERGEPVEVHRPGVG